MAVSASAQRPTVTRTYKSKHTYTAPHPKPRPRPALDRYYDPIGELRLHVTGELGFFDLSGLFMHRLPRHYSVGAVAEFQAGRVFSVGVGAEFYGSRGMNRYNYSDIYLNCVPVFGMARLSTPGRTKLFVEARVGYAIPINQVYLNDPGHTVAAQGLYTSAGVGLNFFGNNISVGFNGIDLRNVTPNQIIPLNNNSIWKRMFTDFFLRYSYAIPLN